MTTSSPADYSSTEDYLPGQAERNEAPMNAINEILQNEATHAAAREPLTAALQDSNKRVRQAAAQALAKIQKAA